MNSFLNSIKLDKEQQKALSKVFDEEVIDGSLDLFIQLVEDDEPVPSWLLGFVASGAKEFRKGGKPWQKGKGGAPSSYGQEEFEAYILYFYGGLSPSEIVALRDYPDDGRDYTKTIRRQIDRGPVAAWLAVGGKPSEPLATFSKLAKMPFDAISPKHAQKCQARLNEEIQKLGGRKG